MSQDTLQDIREQVALAGEEVATAEFLATEGALEWLGVLLEDSQDWAALGIRQWRYLLEDHLHSVEDGLRARSLEDLADLPRMHLQRRMSHLGEGFSASQDLIRRSAARSLDPLRSVWAPFLAMVRRDHRG